MGLGIVAGIFGLAVHRSGHRAGRPPRPHAREPVTAWPRRPGAFLAVAFAIAVSGCSYGQSLQVGAPAPAAPPEMSYLLLRDDGRLEDAAGAAVATAPATTATVAVTAAPNGYWIASADGGVFSYDGAPFHGSGVGLVSDVTAMAAAPDGGGYWLATAAGQIRAFGDVELHGTPQHRIAELVDLEAASDGGGYWALMADGAVLAFGSAPALGAPADQARARPVDIVGSPAARGYWVITEQGRVFAFGAAQHHGDAADLQLAAPVVAMVPTTSGGGYWLFSADGGVFAYGDAAFGGVPPSDAAPVVDALPIVIDTTEGHNAGQTRG